MERKLLMTACALIAASAVSFAQTDKTQVIENGGNGPYKTIVVGDASLPTHTIYRPNDLKAAVAENGKLPVLLYANGGCANRSQDMSHLLSEVASHGYLVIAIGPYEQYDEKAFYDTWRNIIKTMYPVGLPYCTMGNGEKVYPIRVQGYPGSSQEGSRRGSQEEAKQEERTCTGAIPHLRRPAPRGYGLDHQPER
ncbi:MAG: hypothetical protein MJY72_02755 [Bacteroidales bacterium]|nr:hypothetical protein [Bacteroidales bacterium]